MAKEKKLTVGDLIELLDCYKKQGEITDKTQIWLSSDEEGNIMSPLMQFKSGIYNVSVEKKRFTLYPSSAHSNEDGNNIFDDNIFDD